MRNSTILVNNFHIRLANQDQCGFELCPSSSQPVGHNIYQKSSVSYVVVYKFIHFHPGWALDAVGSARILIGKQKIGLTFNSDKLGGNDFTKFSKLTMCSA